MSDKPPAISVIIPSYNRDKTLPRAIDSVLTQTFSDLELLIVDDGSTDNTREVVEEYMLKDSRVKYIYQENARQAAARNNGIKHSRGEFTAFLDSDDEWLSDKLKKQIEYLETHPEFSMVYSNQLMCDSEGASRFLRYRNDQMVEGNILIDLLERRIYCSTQSVMVRSRVIEKVGLFDVDLKNSLEDWEWTLRIAAESPVGCIKEPLVVRYVNNDYSAGYTLLRMDNHRKILTKIFEKYPVPVAKQKELWKKAWFSWGIAALESGCYIRSAKCFTAALFRGKWPAAPGLVLTFCGPLGRFILKNALVKRNTRPQ